MGFLTLIIIVVLIGLVVYAVRRFVPLDPAFHTIVLVVGIIVAVVIVLSAFGLLPMGDIAVPKLR